MIDHNSLYPSSLIGSYLKLVFLAGIAWTYIAAYCKRAATLSISQSSIAQGKFFQDLYTSATVMIPRRVRFDG